MKRRLVLIDGHAAVFRAYYAFPATLTTPEGEQVNAVYGFLSILLNVIKELRPSHIAVTFDMDKPTFRHLDFVDYKAHRPEVDQELKDQLDKVRESVKVLNMPIFEVEGFEADDVIGTLAKQSYDKEIETIIVTGDQDAMQLVNGNVFVYVPARGKQAAKIYKTKDVRKRYGFKPIQMIDYKALCGDPSDNIPGIKGIGPKTAVDLIEKFKSVEGIYENLEKAFKKGKVSKGVYQKLIDGYDNAVQSKRLATIVLDVPITLKLRACQLHDYDKKKAVKFLEKLGFKSIIKRLPSDDWEQTAEEVFAKKKKKQKKEDNKEQMGLF